MTRIRNGGSSRQSDIYLRDWSIKNELRNRAMLYDYVSLIYAIFYALNEK